MIDRAQSLIISNWLATVVTLGGCNPQETCALDGFRDEVYTRLGHQEPPVPELPIPLVDQFGGASSRPDEVLP